MQVCKCASIQDHGGVVPNRRSCRIQYAVIISSVQGVITEVQDRTQVQRYNGTSVTIESIFCSVPLKVQRHKELEEASRILPLFRLIK